MIFFFFSLDWAKQSMCLSRWLKCDSEGCLHWRAEDVKLWLCASTSSFFLLCWCCGFRKVVSASLCFFGLSFNFCGTTVHHILHAQSYFPGLSLLALCWEAALVFRTSEPPGMSLNPPTNKILLFSRCSFCPAMCNSGHSHILFVFVLSFF